MSRPIVNVKVRTVYGNRTFYPMGSNATLFARIAGTTTLTEAALKLIAELGFGIEYHADVPANVPPANPANVRYECSAGCGAVWFADTAGTKACPTCRTLTIADGQRDETITTRFEGFVGQGAAEANAAYAKIADDKGYNPATFNGPDDPRHLEIRQVLVARGLL